VSVRGMRGDDQSGGALKSTVRPENLASPKLTWPPENFGAGEFDHAAGELGVAEVDLAAGPEGKGSGVRRTIDSCVVTANPRESPHHLQTFCSRTT
jgi:hypothetical protein